MICIIPARKGSKTIKNKNVKHFCGKPLIFWTIDAAIKSKNINKIIVTTDCPVIAKMCKKYSRKVEVPFLRPKFLSTDKSPAIETYIYTSEKINRSGYKCDEFIVLLPTSPLRTSTDINNSIKIFYKTKADSVISCVKADHPYHWYLSLRNKKKIREVFKIKDLQSKMNRQKNENLYIPNGSIYILKKSLIKINKSYYSKNSVAYLMPKSRSIDINNSFDFKLAESIKNFK